MSWQQQGNSHPLKILFILCKLNYKLKVILCQRQSHVFYVTATDISDIKASEPETDIDVTDVNCITSLGLTSSKEDSDLKLE